VAAFAAGAAAGLVALASLVFLRGSGGWLCLHRLRRGQVEDCNGRRWDELTALERGWFYGAVVWVAAAVCFGVLGAALNGWD
jgi:hypothetical protein